MASTYYLTPNPMAGGPAGSGYSPDGTLPAGAVECTQAEAQNPGAYTITAGAIAPWLPSLAQAQATQIATLSAACRSAIEAGFTSSALGGAYTYGCRPTDQANVATVAAHGGSLWCQPSGGAWAFVAHTAAQALQVQADMGTHIQAEQATYAGLVGQVGVAATVSAVQAIVWP